jgi:hypothetical protein
MTPMPKRLILLGVLAAAPALPIDSEITRLGDSCGDFKIVPCLTTLFTDHPFHIGVSSLAPGNGFAFGPALTFTHHTKPKRIPGPDGDTETNWRYQWDGDAVISSNQSWRTGVYMTARYTRIPPTIVVGGVAPAGKQDLRPSTWVFTAYAQAESLNRLSFYGIGPNSSRSALTHYGQRQTIVGGTATLPLWRQTLTLFAEANARIVNLRPDRNDGAPSIEQVYTPVTLPGLQFETASFGQFAQGLRFAPSWKDRFALNYVTKMQEYTSPGSGSSFSRLVVDLGHEYSIYGHSKPAPAFNGPNSCNPDRASACPKPSMAQNLEGSLVFRFVLNQSYFPSGNAVPFYFQPTLGGSDINGNNVLPSYADYRFRGPNVMLFHESFGHSLGKLPVGFIFMADQGTVSNNQGTAFSVNNLVHSYAAGLTLRAGGFPVLSVTFGWGGKEGTHTLAQVSNTLLGGGSRPSLY